MPKKNKNTWYLRRHQQFPRLPQPRGGGLHVQRGPDRVPGGARHHHPLHAADSQHRRLPRRLPDPVPECRQQVTCKVTCSHIFCILTIEEKREINKHIYLYRYLTATDYFAAAGYRTALAGTYYPSEYHAALQNGYLDPSTRIPGLASYDQVSVSLTVII